MEDIHSLFYPHVIVGSSILTLTVLRLVVRLRSKDNIPQPSRELSPQENKMATIGHYALYAVLIITALTGLLSLSQEDPFEEVHGPLAFILIALIAGHALMVIKHKVVHKINLMERII